jgi:TfoX/Sxy family transcriptional regulator of competence genes
MMACMMGGYAMWCQLKMIAISHAGRFILPGSLFNRRLLTFQNMT